MPRVRTVVSNATDRRTLHKVHWQDYPRRMFQETTQYAAKLNLCACQKIRNINVSDEMVMVITGHSRIPCSTKAGPFDNAKLTFHSKSMTERSAIFCFFHFIISSIFERHTARSCASFDHSVPPVPNSRPCKVDRGIANPPLSSDSAPTPFLCMCKRLVSLALGRSLTFVPHGHTTSSNWRSTSRLHVEVCVFLCSSVESRAHRIISLFCIFHRYPWNILQAAQYVVLQCPEDECTVTVWDE